MNAAEDSKNARAFPYGLQSLRDMINFQLFALCRFLLFLQKDEENLRSWLDTGIAPAYLNLEHGVPEYAPILEIERAKGTFKSAEIIATYLDLQPVIDRVQQFIIKSRYQMKLDVLVNELRVLRETVDDVISFKYFYHYPQEKALILLKFERDWERVNSQFPLAKEDARAAVDCWALGHNTASIFHFMRVAELGLRAIAKERRVTLPKNKAIEWATWLDIIKAIRTAQDEIGRTKPACQGKDDALAFYSGALAHLEGFKDKYRNMVMHVRKDYDEHQAASAMMHVREFMTGLSAKIGENPKPIRWKFR